MSLPPGRPETPSETIRDDQDHTERREPAEAPVQPGGPAFVAPVIRASSSSRRLPKGGLVDRTYALGG
ncbi:hypothetical protein [Streptomyces glaucescens]|uniref:hypothetical protein n=1 Tax=Streptomyces glaucescens TaxID=1907 RepID=UPI000A399D1D|nr:hypothetical protein [Streptomyces glaucescens]